MHFLCKYVAGSEGKAGVAPASSKCTHTDTAAAPESITIMILRIYDYQLLTLVWTGPL